MLLRLLLISLLIKLVCCDEFSSRNEALRSKLNETTVFFQKLRAAHALDAPYEDALSAIEQKISEYVSNETGGASSIRTRRETEQPEKGINILQGFEDLYVFKWRNIKDISFFTFPNEEELISFAVVLNTSNIFLVQLNNETVDQIGSYSGANSTRIIVDSCIAGALLIVQKETGEIIVSRLSRPEEDYVPYTVQEFEPSGVTHLATWHGMNQLYLGMTSASTISIFTWLGEHFDLVQDLNIRAERLHPFYSKGFMHLAAIGPRTTILRYSLRSNKFLPIQTLPGSEDVSSFHVKEGRFVEYFLALSVESSIILYKELLDRYVPFQQIPSGSSPVFLTMHKSILLFALDNETVASYQYDGWKFIRLDVKIENVRQIRRIKLLGEETLLVEFLDNAWKLMRPAWTAKKLWRNLQDEIKTWCIGMKVQAQRRPKEIPRLEAPLRILNGHIDTLSAHRLNGYKGMEFGEISRKLEQLASRLQERKNDETHQNDRISLKSMNAERVRIRCRSKCTVARLKVDTEEGPYAKTKSLTKSNDSMENLRRKKLQGLTCPRIAVPMETLYVKKLLNGVSLAELEADLLRVTGDQEIRAECSFSSLNATRTRIPAELASHETSQPVYSTETRVRELTIQEGGFLVPLNGPETVISGSITVPKVTVSRPTVLNGRLTGEAASRVDPFTIVSGPLDLAGDYSLGDVTIESLLSAGDIVSDQRESLDEIIEDSVSLTDNVPVTLILSGQKTKWRNVTVRNHPSWITASPGQTIVIEGRKRAVRNLTVTEDIYSRIKFPKIANVVCGLEVIVPEIQRSVVRMGSLTVNELNSRYVQGKVRNENVSFGSPSHYLENRTHDTINVRNLSVNGLDLEELRTFASAWTPPNVYRGSINGSQLTVGTLRFPVTFVPVFLPDRMRNIVSRKNLRVKRINGVDLEEFLMNAVNVEESAELGNVTFAKGFVSNNTNAKNLVRNSSLEMKLDLGRKRILGNLESGSIKLPFNDNQASNVNSTGDVTFSLEPAIEKINGISLRDLSKEIWMRGDNCTISAKNIRLENVSLEGDIVLNDQLQTESYGSWKNLSERVLSKTKPQEIPVNVSMQDVEVRSIDGSSSSAIKCEDPDITDLLSNTLMKGRDAVVKSTWRFERLNVSGRLSVEGKINNLNLKRDVVRRDSETNRITGKKTVLRLATEDLHGLKFKEWTEKALVPRKRKLAVIKGRKRFNSVTIDSLNVSGTIMGREMEQAMLKSTGQRISGGKRIEGSVTAAGLTIDGPINDANLTDLMEQQLKRRSTEQIIETPIEFSLDLRVIGNLTIDGLLGHNFSVGSYERMASVAEEVLQLWEAAETIDIALQNRAIYVNKLQTVEEPPHFIQQNATMSTHDEYKCRVENSTLICNEQTLLDLSFASESNDFILMKLIALNDLLFTIAVQNDSVSVYTANDTRTGFTRVSDLHIPSVNEAFVEPYKDSIWIALQLPVHTLVLRYEQWNDFEEYLLPESRVFSMSRAPNGQLFLILSDGIWNLEGLGAPRNVLPIGFCGDVETYSIGADYFIKSTTNGNSTVYRARYVGN